MTSGVSRLDALSSDEAARELLAFCGSDEWARRMAAARPFGTPARLLEAADLSWSALSAAGRLQALSRHPRIGDPGASGQPAREQSAMRDADAETARDLALANRDYEERFGRIFIVAAAGRTAAEMLALCRERLHNDAATELEIAAEEQRRITRLRLEAFVRET
ncbi:MAG: 2-oxo-4-hydroxy-4-carboxy-5-ureidoimidazoline decarboxylase [Acidobacteriota bacterium]